MVVCDGAVRAMKWAVFVSLDKGDWDGSACVGTGGLGIDR